MLGLLTIDMNIPIDKHQRQTNSSRHDINYIRIATMYFELAFLNFERLVTTIALS